MKSKQNAQQNSSHKVRIVFAEILSFPQVGSFKWAWIDFIVLVYRFLHARNFNVIIVNLRCIFKWYFCFVKSTTKPCKLREKVRVNYNLVWIFPMQKKRTHICLAPKNTTWFIKQSIQFIYKFEWRSRIFSV